MSHVLTHAAFDCRADTGDKSRHILRMIDVALPHRSFDSPAIVLKSQERYRIPLRPVLVVLKANALVELFLHGVIGFHCLLCLIQLTQIVRTGIAINPRAFQELRVRGDIVLGFLLQFRETISVRSVPCPALNAVSVTDQIRVLIAQMLFLRLRLLRPILRTLLRRHLLELLLFIVRQIVRLRRGRFRGTPRRPDGFQPSVQRRVGSIGQVDRLTH